MTFQESHENIHETQIENISSIHQSNGSDSNVINEPWIKRLN